MFFIKIKKKYILFNEKLIMKINYYFNDLREVKALYMINLLNKEDQQQIEVEYNIKKKNIKIIKILLQKVDIFIEHIMIKERELTKMKLLELFKVKLFKEDELVDLIVEIQYNKNEELIFEMMHNKLLLKEVI